MLVDTSVWVNHLRSGLPSLAAALESNTVMIHPWIIGELACGNLRDRIHVLDLLQSLPAGVVATDGEVLLLIEQQLLMGRGIGYVDAHLLASARLSRCRLWTDDRRLHNVALELGVGMEPSAQ